MKRVLLTSTGFANKNFETLFKSCMSKPMSDCRILFATVDSNTQVGLRDLANAGVRDLNICIYNFDRFINSDTLLNYDAIYCYGSNYDRLEKAITEQQMRDSLLYAVEHGLFYVGAGAGSLIANYNCLGLLGNIINIHCDKNASLCGKATVTINLSDEQAVWLTNEKTIIIK